MIGGICKGTAEDYEVVAVEILNKLVVESPGGTMYYHVRMCTMPDNRCLSG
ncbi:predicted protein [Botrytis cinerea T4]|uniref:Uncharacterized protein n=1 Tax=Botryotinia fuckeliana (strain T4) TaxID=999810 RepID=G2YUF1_BOTF4|nr:predicted protein [Botrytis cinerea T4]